MRLIGAGLRCIRGGRDVFSDLALMVDAGEALAVTGPNGSGKSSLLRLIAGLVRREAGTLTLEGGDPQSTIPEQAHYLGHQDPLKPSLTVRENLATWAAVLSSESPAPGAEALATVGLSDIADLPAGYLSAGQRRRLSIARLLAAPRPLWLLDEPTAPLDAQGEAVFSDIMRRHLATGGLIIAATHAPLALDGVRQLRLGRQTEAVMQP